MGDLRKHLCRCPDWAIRPRRLGGLTTTPRSTPSQPPASSGSSTGGPASATEYAGGSSRGHGRSGPSARPCVFQRLNTLSMLHRFMYLLLHSGLPRRMLPPNSRGSSSGSTHTSTSHSATISRSLRARCMVECGSPRMPASPVESTNGSRLRASTNCRSERAID